MAGTWADRQEIQSILDNWAVFRDAGDWERFKTVWHAGATITTLWYQGPWEGYMEKSREGWGRGMSSVHYLCGCQIDMNGDRATSRTNMRIYGRGVLDGVDFDMEATAQFYDFHEKRDGRWGMAERCVIHIKDRIDPVEAGGRINLDTKLLAEQPAHYRHLAYFHAKMGRPVKRDMPGLAGLPAERLAQRGKAWLAGEKLPAVA